MPVLFCRALDKGLRRGHWTESRVGRLAAAGIPAQQGDMPVQVDRSFHMFGRGVCSDLVERDIRRALERGE